MPLLVTLDSVIQTRELLERNKASHVAIGETKPEPHPTHYIEPSRFAITLEMLTPAARSQLSNRIVVEAYASELTDPALFHKLTRSTYPFAHLDQRAHAVRWHLERADIKTFAELEEYVDLPTDESITDRQKALPYYVRESAVRTLCAELVTFAREASIRTGVELPEEISEQALNAFAYQVRELNRPGIGQEQLSIA